MKYEIFVKKDKESMPLSLKNQIWIVVPFLTICGGIYQLIFWLVFGLNGLSFISLSDIIKSSIPSILPSSFIALLTLFIPIFAKWLHKIIGGKNSDTGYQNSLMKMIIMILGIVSSISWIYYLTHNKPASVMIFYPFGILYCTLTATHIYDLKANSWIKNHFGSANYIQFLCSAIIFSLVAGLYNGVQIRDNLSYKYSIVTTDNPINKLCINDTIKLIGYAEKYIVFTPLNNSRTILINNSSIDTLVLYDKGSIFD